MITALLYVSKEKIVAFAHPIGEQDELAEGNILYQGQEDPLTNGTNGIHGTNKETGFFWFWYPYWSPNWYWYWV